MCIMQLAAHANMPRWFVRRRLQQHCVSEPDYRAGVGLKINSSWEHLFDRGGRVCLV